MSLVFFDIECASVYKTTAKICAFGYVVCDENFNIIEKEDILINPKGAFHLTDSKGEKGLVLPYKYADFKKYPDFRAVYPKIKALLEDENNIVAGHATYNDVNYLNLETRRFKLPSFSFSFSDTQLLYMTMTGGFSRQYGLGYIAEALNVDFTQHCAADDAYATMRVAEAMCRARGCSFTELESALNITRGRIENYSIFKPRSSGYSEYTEERRAAKEERSRARRDFYIYLSRKKGAPKAGSKAKFSTLPALSKTTFRYPSRSLIKFTRAEGNTRKNLQSATFMPRRRAILPRARVWRFQKRACRYLLWKSWRSF